MLSMRVSDLPGARGSLRPPALAWGLGGIVLGGVIWLVHRHGDGLYGLVLTYLFPADWHEAVRFLGDQFVQSQARPIVRNMLLGASLVLCSLLLFWLKELLSITFERDAGLKRGPHDEFPIGKQVLEELVVCYTSPRLYFQYKSFECVVGISIKGFLQLAVSPKKNWHTNLIGGRLSGFHSKANAQ
jgi:hypothetical protein